jgi:hypothetical protein
VNLTKLDWCFQEACAVPQKRIERLERLARERRLYGVLAGVFAVAVCAFEIYKTFHGYSKISIVAGLVPLIIFSVLARDAGLSISFSV